MSFKACAELVRNGDPDRYLSVMAAVPEARDRLFALYAFNLEVARAPWASNEPMIAEMRLQWWHDAIAAIYEGRPVGGHEVGEALSAVIAEHDLPRKLFADLVAARRFDIYREGHDDRAAFDVYIDVTSGNLMQLAALSLGAGKGTMPVIADFAYGAGVANLLRALPALYNSGCNPVPFDGDQQLQVLAKLASDAAGKIADARKMRSCISKSVVAAMLAGWQADAVLDYAQKNPPDILNARLEPSEFRKKSSLLWRSYTGLW